MMFNDCDAKRFFQELKYYLLYYGNDFKEDQGLERIISVIIKYAKEGSWCDLGGGSNTRFWRMAFPKLSSIECYDMSKESFLLSEIIENNFSKSGCYKFIEDFVGVRANLNNDVEIKYYKTDLLNDKIMIKRSYDNITQIGLLGLIDNKDKFISKTHEIIDLLSIGGVYIGANWIFNSKYSNKININNNYITPALIENMIKNTSVKLCYCEEIPLKNDENYLGFILYVIQNMPDVK